MIKRKTPDLYYVSTRVSADVKRQLDEIGKAEHRNTANMIQLAVDMFVASRYPARAAKTGATK